MTAACAAAASLLLTATPAAAQMSVGEFLERAEPLREGGLTAMLSGDLPVLRAEAMDALAQMRAERDARRAAGKPPLYCKPTGAPDPGVNEMIDGLERIPERQQGMPLKDGIIRVMQQMYPCGKAARR